MSVKIPAFNALRGSAVVVLVFSIGAVVVDLLVAGEIRRVSPDDPAWLTDALSPALLKLLVGVASACVLLGLAALVRALASVAEQRRVEAGGTGASDVSTRALDDLTESVNTLTRQLDARDSDRLVSPGDTAQSPLPQASSLNEKLLERMVFLLEEMRETSMMDEAQRRERLLALFQRRKHASLADISRHVHHEEWARADQLLLQLERQHPGDTELVEARSVLEVARGAAERRTLELVRGKVEDDMAVGSWDQALNDIRQFALNFPANSDGRTLLARVTRERELFRESTVQRFYEEAKYELERRNWRRALSAVQKLSERYPDHAKTQKLRPQFRTIQENAEIEERQEMESRIRELVQGKRFSDAIALSEDLLRRFPKSPQADAIEELLPKMRDLAIQHEADAIKVRTRVDD